MSATQIADPRLSDQYVGTVAPSPGAPADVTKSNYALRQARPAQKVYTSGSVGAGAAIDSGVLDTSMLEGISVEAVNSSAVTGRTVTLTFLAEDGTTVLHTISRALAISTTERYVIGACREAAGLIDVVVIACPLDTPPKFRLQVAAAGADAAELRSWGH